MALLSQLAELAEMLVLQSLDTDWPLPRALHLDKAEVFLCLHLGTPVPPNSALHHMALASVLRKSSLNLLSFPLVTHGPWTSVMVICFGKCQSDIFGEKEESTCR